MDLYLNIERLDRILAELKKKIPPVPNIELVLNEISDGIWEGCSSSETEAESSMSGTGQVNDLSDSEPEPNNVLEGIMN